MEIEVEPGTYVVAVSGGVDSMVLLDVLVKRNQTLHPTPYTLVVAHFDHGIRPDSAEDRKLVQRTAELHDLPFVFHEAGLGKGASEALARKVRYEFLHKVREAAGAQAVLTAHHQDDLLETAILNMLRGTARKGLSSLKSTDTVKRPLLHVPKQELEAYAKAHTIPWREDATNKDTSYKRNYIRHALLPKLSKAEKAELLTHLQKVNKASQAIDTELAHYFRSEKNTHELNRDKFISLPHKAAMEVMAAWLRSHEIREFDKKLLEQLTIAAKTLPPGKQSNINRNYKLLVRDKYLALVTRDR